jgi:outer membrane protein TolC
MMACARFAQGRCAAVVVLSLAGGATVAAQSGLSVFDAAQVTLAEQPQIKFQREQLTLAEGALQAVSGRFDLRFNGSADRSRATTPLRVQDQAPDLTTAVANQTDYSLGLAMPLRTGLTLSPTIGVTRQDLEYNPLATNRALIGFGLLQPLMRGRGTDVVTAAETAARYEVSATTDDLRYTAAISVYQTAVAYWTYVGAYRTLDVVQASEARARRLVEELTTLIAAGNRPAADIREANANLAARSALRISYQQAVFQARQALGLSMGLTADRAAALPAPLDAFPALADDVTAHTDPRLLDTALANRPDLDATRERERETRTLTVPARDQLRPQVDLQVNVGYSGLVEGNQFPGLFTSIGSRLTGPNFLAAVIVSQAKDNNTAHGQLLQTEAAHRQAQIRVDDLSRSIQSNVKIAQDNLERSAERARLLNTAASEYRVALDNERDKAQLGRSTVIELLLIEDRLTASQLDEVTSMQAYASALAQLRYETGTLIGGDAPGFVIAPAALTTVPQPGPQ